MVEGPRVPPGPKKHFCSQTLGRQGKPSLPRPPPSWARPQRESATAARREVRCAKSQKYRTLKIHAMSPVHYVYARPARARGRERRVERRRRGASSPPPRAPGRRGGRRVRAGRGAEERKGPGGRPGSSKPQVCSSPQPPPIFVQRLLRRGEAGLRKRAAGADAPAGLWSPGGGLRVRPSRRGLRASGSRERGPGRGHRVCM